MASVAAAQALMASEWRGGAYYRDARLRLRYSEVDPRALPAPDADWACSACAGVNFARRLQCYSCGAPRTADTPTIDRDAPSTVLRIQDLADTVTEQDLEYAIKRAGFKILEVPTEWTDKMGSKVVLGRTSLTMLLSIIRLRLVHSPFYRPLRPLLRPLETWVYAKLKAPLLRRPTKSWDTDFTH